MQGDVTVVCKALNIIVNYFMVCTYFWVLCEGELLKEGVRPYVHV